MNTKTMTPDERLIEASEHYRVNDDGELERVSWPFDNKHMGRPTKIGVGFDHVGGSGYKQFKHPLFRGGRQSSILSHRMVFYLAYGELPQFVDHIDGDKLNNRPSNLRSATRSQNAQNKRSGKGSSSKYLGVLWIKPRRKWRAQIRIEGASCAIGHFTDEIDAAKAYDAKARELFGEFANPNFPA